MAAKAESAQSDQLPLDATEVTMSGYSDRTVTANGLRFHYVERGKADAPVLLCLHGITQTAHTWDEVAEALASDYRVLCLDQRGHGDSDWAPDGQYDRESMAADIGAVASALGIGRFLLCGMSMGGINAITFAARHPQAVLALVIVDVSPEIQAEGVRNLQHFLQVADELPSFEAFVEHAHRFNPRRSLDNLRSRLSHNLKQLPNGNWTWKYDRALRSGARSFEATALVDLWDEIAKIRCPTLIVRGAESDILSGESAARMQAAIPASHLAVIPRAGHSVMGDNPQRFVEVVRDFLRGLRL